MVTENLNQTLHQHFDKVLVLTIPRLKERQEQVRQRLNGIDFEFFYGADKQELTEGYIAQHYHYDKKLSLSVSQYFKPLNNGEIACALSHRMIYQAMIDHNWQSVLVFEDDVVPDDRYVTKVAECLKELPRDWELFYLGYLKNEKATMARRIKRSWYLLQAAIGLSRLPARMIRNYLPADFSPFLSKAGFHDCTHAYAITLDGAKKLLAAQTPIKYRADNLLSALVLKGEIKAFVSKRQLFNQEIFSDSGNTSHVREKQKLSVR